MSARLGRTVRSFAVVFAAFLVYRLLLSPWIDPSFALEERLGASDEDINRFHQADKQRLQKYERIFPPGSWELDQPIMLESDGVELLMKDYENLPDGKIRLSRCTMLYLSENPAGDTAPGRVVVLRAPEGALLQFDSGLNLKRGKLGKLIGGELKGPVTIHGTPSRPGADDELFIATRDIRMDERKIWSHSRVEFRYGPNDGKGRDLVIHLSPGGNARPGRGPNIAGLQQFELSHDVEMHLVPGSSGLFPGDGTPEAASTDAPRPGRELDQKPVDIRCAGPFRFHMVERAASFINDVKVFRAIGEGASDQMMCDELRIVFGERPQAAAQQRDDANRKAGLAEGRRSLQAERIVANGNPVIIDAPSNALSARADTVEFEVAKNRVGIKAAANHPHATLNWQNNRFVGRSLIVERPSPKSLPIVSAAGEGWLRIAEPDDPTRTLEASWSRELAMRPIENKHQVSLVGDARCNFAAFGELQAGEIQLRLVEMENPVPNNLRDGAPRPYPVAPEHMLALRGVRFRSTQLSGDTERLEVTFRPADKTLGTSDAQFVNNNLIARGAASHKSAPSQPADSSRGATPPARQPGTATTNPAAPAAAPERQFELHGQRIDAHLVSLGPSGRFQLDNATIAGQVRCLETRTEKPSDHPIDIQGDLLNVQAAATPAQTTVVVHGKPALIAARGMQMFGGEIHFDRGQNLVWIDGAGRMLLPARRAEVPPSPENKNASATRSQFGGFDSLAGAPSSIDFTGGMKFDGKLARYEREVVVKSESQAVRPNQQGAFETRRFTLETDTLTVSLARPIDFSSEHAPGQAEVDVISCPGPVTMTQRTSDERGQSAIDTLVCRDLSIHQSTGDIQAFGPGTYETTRLGSSSPFASGGAPRPAKTQSAAPDTPIYARVDFRGPVTGNSRLGELVLHDDIRGVYGPVANWNDKLDFDPDRIADGMIFRSDQLRLRQTPGAKPNTGAIEVQAVGNTDVDGQTFSARAHSLSYVVGKDQLVLEGDGRSVADLYYQPRAGGPRSRARADKIEYWHTSGQVNVNGARFFDIGQLGGASSGNNQAR